MSNIGFVMFTYSSPQEDLVKSTCHNANGDTNINLTLHTYRDLLMSNIAIIDTLISVSDKIQDIEYTGYKLIALTTDSQELMDDLTKKNIVVSIPDISDSDSDSEDDNYSDDDYENINTETNTNRFESIINLTRLQNIPVVESLIDEPEYSNDDIYESNNESELDINENINTILDKYINLREKNQIPYVEDIVYNANNYNDSGTFNDDDTNDDDTNDDDTNDDPIDSASDNDII